MVGKGRFAYVTGLNRYLLSLFLCINRNSFEKQYRQTKSFMTSSKKKASSHSLFCTDKDCTSVFPNESIGARSLKITLLVQDHSYFSKAEVIHKTSDKVKILFAQKLKNAKIAERNYLTSSISNDCKLTPRRNRGSGNPLEDGKTMGWASRKRRKNTTFSERQVRFLVDMHEEGEKRKKKDAATVADMMLHSKGADRWKLFSPGEYLRREQILSFPSRIRGSRRRNISFKDMLGQGSDTEDADCDIEECLEELEAELDLASLKEQTDNLERNELDAEDTSVTTSCCSLL